ncbi:putative DsbA family dithiol-disulfide isomerase [Thiogranum longum]|uniref:Putative DsbA family dithiol-disulfide isomerase n=1 Tax=Thiogranum longum TaxID=1537524 RepID=A0A4R1HAF9_9GAMM|nr:DsbA family protein [Thiogranum longum]TCK18924.1 putative DsbA family dithiol-disulfide isomerase [Thiogranum longum]
MASAEASGDVTEGAGKPSLKVTVFSDYICPFCYIGDLRLNRLREQFDLRVNWCAIEIHPGTSPDGQPIESLGYDSERWQAMMASLKDMAAQEGVLLKEHDFTTRSRSALLLAESAKLLGRDVFYHLHNALFEAFFVEGRNIGDRMVLEELARNAGMTDSQITAAWDEPESGEKLARYRQAALDLGVNATPTFFVGEQRLDGAVPYAQLLEAAHAASK